jgi:hypothetical protein
MDLDCAVDIRKQPNPEPVALGNCTLMLFLISHPVILSFGVLSQMIICIVLTVVPHHGINNFIHVRSSHFPGLVWHNTLNRNKNGYACKIDVSILTT